MKPISNAAFNAKVSTIKTHTLKCPICDYCFDSKVDTKKSTRKHSIEKPLACPSCEHRVKNEEHIRSHTLNHTEANVVTSKISPMTANGTIPNDSKLSLNLFECSPPSPILPIPLSFSNQIQIEHNNCETNNCTVCSSQFDPPLELSIHFNNSHIYKMSQV